MHKFKVLFKKIHKRINSKNKDFSSIEIIESLFESQIYKIKDPPQL